MPIYLDSSHLLAQSTQAAVLDAFAAHKPVPDPADYDIVLGVLTVHDSIEVDVGTAEIDTARIRAIFDAF